MYSIVIQGIPANKLRRSCRQLRATGPQPTVVDQTDEQITSWCSLALLLSFGTKQFKVVQDAALEIMVWIWISTAALMEA
jgi:hypothetical protein